MATIQNSDQNNSGENSDEAILEVAKARFDRAAEAEVEIRKAALEDDKFSIGQQWDPEVLAARKADQRPCFTVNRLPQQIRQVTNDQRQNRPAIKVSPVDDKADVETAKIFQGLIRHIEYKSNADTAYATAGGQAVRGGYGFFRIMTEYCNPMSFDQEIKIKRIPDRFSVYLDPNFTEPDGSDANWGFVFENISHDDYKAQYPNSKLTSMDDWTSLGNTAPEWVQKDTVRVAEYFYKTFEEKEICLLSNGQVIEKSKLPKLPGSLGVDQNGQPLRVVKERKSLIPQVKWCKTNGVEILEQTDWAGKWIPIVPVLGEDLVIEGKKILVSLIRDAKDPQKLYNYWKSSEAETIALSPKAPFIGYEGQFEGHEEQWRTANTRNHAFLQVKPITIGGTAAPLPQRNSFEPPVAAITNASLYAADDIKATTGIYDAALGAKSNENSGIAIQRRNVQSQTSNFHFMDNQSKSIRHGGRIILDLIPHIYDTARAARILGEDGSEEIIRLNEEFERNGQMVAFYTGVGEYDVAIDTGPSFETKRQEAVATQTELAKSYPKLLDVAGDIVIGNMDIPGAKDISQRIKKTLPPGLADDGKQNPLPPEAQAQMQQMNQMIEQLTNQLNVAHDALDKKTIEIESRERIEMMKIQANAEIELARLGSKESLALLNHQISQIQQRLSLLNLNQPIESEENEPMAGSNQAVPLDEYQQPTGGNSPGQPMGEYP